MRSNLTAELDCEQLLTAMSHAFLASSLASTNQVEIDAGVVHALLQARYYDGGKGEFLSEDPVFLGDPKQQVLTDPQSLNSYSYANDNPIINKDPTGKYFEVSAGGTIPFAWINGAAGNEHAICRAYARWPTRTGHVRLFDRDAVSDLYTSVLPQRGCINLTAMCGSSR